uniref:Kinase n=1 Tax=Caenorhabditis angaria TaxID=860376 RepID=B6VBT9_9PELO|nr:hypothetical protein Csp3_JD02.010 [Caenorhabditis angaria]
MVLNIKRASSLEETSVEIHDDILKPFVHQVGGHTPFTSLPNGHLLKPCDVRELHFYQQMPDHLKWIAPLCCTTIQGGSVNILPHSCIHCKTRQLENVIIPESIEGSPILNKRKLSKFFIVLSDLTYRMRSPRVLDLKLGTRQHGDQASLEKAACMTAKCRSTTSATLGIRLCGMKYQCPNTQQQIVYGKYEGRSMSELTLYENIIQFCSINSEILEIVKRKLEAIHSIIKKSYGLRLFGASLLIVLEGDPISSQTIDELVQIKIVDYANSTFNGFLTDNFYEGPDDGSLLGIETILRFLD